MRIIILSFIFYFSSEVNGQLYFPPTSGNTWDTLPSNSLGLCPEKIGSLYNYLDSNDTKAFILLKDGKIILEKYFGTFTKDSNWYWASAGKTLTALCIGIAQQEGKLKLTDTSSKYLGNGWTSLTAAQEDKITIWHQLSMTSGMNDSIFECTLPICLKYKADAGTRWSYHNGPYTLLDSVLYSATGQSLNAFISSKLTPSTGFKGLFIKSGYNNVCYSTARNMARFGLLLLNKGKWGSTDILKDTVYHQQMTTSSQLLNPSYGYLTWLNGKSSYMMPSSQLLFSGLLMTDAPTDMYAAMGKNGQFINIVPSQNLVLVRTGNVPNSTNVPKDFNNEIWRRLNLIMCKSHGSIADISKEIKIYPNPAKSYIHIESEHKDLEYSISDFTGKKIQFGEINNQNISLNGIEKGIYFLKLVNSTSSFYLEKKIIVE